ncbi:type II secretion system F family protein [Parasulfitobacter algicola]|uniref:Type II secretion system F family protein n=1 Tax=Parasulfitobacter algicola TaxID=2614809 RepID=A0ABX2ISW8_9RHOB|nr:type II secretion system F family protein [Sulfitobacter algicola]NSX56007.1 type II secretion system F family protein [Sulfitobacter algicola]
MEFLTQINDMLTDRFGPLGPLLAVGVLGFLLILLTLPIFLKKQKDPLARLKEANKDNTPKEKKQSLRLGGKFATLNKYSNFLEPENEEEYSATRLKLLQAGYRGKDAVRTFHFASFALGIGLLAFGALLALVRIATTDGISTTSLLLTVFIPGLIGYMLPKYWVTRRKQARQDEIINGFPDALDMMLVCVEAGQSLDQSIIRVSGEIKAGYPALSEEFETVAQEMKAGKEKSNVLRDMSERADVQDVSSFVTVLIQSAQFGTSIADALRVYASEMRDKRVMRAEEKANKLPTKMTLATMMLTVPPLLIILIGPSIYSIYNTMMNMTVN